MSKRKNDKNLQRVWKQIVSKTSVRQWLLGSVFFVGLVAIFLFNALPMGVSVEVGKVAKRDLTAPRTAINRAETTRLQESAEKQALLEVNEDPNYYAINHAAILKVEENLTGILNVLRSSIPPDPLPNPEQNQDSAGTMEEKTGDALEPTPLSPSEVDRRLIRDWKVEIPNSILEEISQLSLSEFDLFAQFVTDSVLEQMQERISEDGLRDARDQFEQVVRSKGLSSSLEQAPF